MGGELPIGNHRVCAVFRCLSVWEKMVWHWHKQYDAQHSHYQQVNDPGSSLEAGSVKHTPVDEHGMPVSRAAGAPTHTTNDPRPDHDVEMSENELHAADPA